MLPTHDVPCPHCGQALFSSVSLDEGINEGSPLTPPVEHDAAGDFMRCPSCKARVGVERIVRGGSSEIRLAR